MAFDGCSKGNPGRAGAGAVIYCNHAEIWADAKFVGAKETNNVAEYAGLIMGLHEALRRNIKQITVQGDSELIIKQMKKEYAVKSPNIKEPFIIAKILSFGYKEISFANFKALEYFNSFSLISCFSMILSMVSFKFCFCVFSFWTINCFCIFSMFTYVS